MAGVPAARLRAGPEAAHRGVPPAGPASATLEKLDDFRQELRDRYGPLPEPAEWLLRTTEVRLLAARWQVAGVHRDGPDLVFSYRNAAKANELAAKSKGRVKVVDEKMYLRLRPGEEDAGGDVRAADAGVGGVDAIRYRYAATRRGARLERSAACRGMPRFSRVSGIS